MPFGKTKEETQREVLAELFPGKTKEELDRMVASFAATEAQARRATELETQLAASNVELATTKLKVTELETSRGNNGNNNNNNNNNNQNEAPRWDEDAQAAFNHNIAPLVGETLKTRADFVYETVTGRLERTEPLFQNATIRKEFDEMLKKSTLQAQATKEFVQNCFDVVVGRHIGEIRRDTMAGKGDFFVESGRNAGGGGSNNNNNRVDSTKILSDEEKKEAAKFGLTEEQWLKTRNAIRFVGGGVINQEMR